MLPVWLSNVHFKTLRSYVYRGVSWCFRSMWPHLVISKVTFRTLKSCVSRAVSWSLPLRDLVTPTPGIIGELWNLPKLSKFYSGDGVSASFVIWFPKRRQVFPSERTQQLLEFEKKRHHKGGSAGKEELWLNKQTLQESFVSLRMFARKPTWTAVFLGASSFRQLICRTFLSY